MLIMQISNANREISLLRVLCVSGRRQGTEKVKGKGATASAPILKHGETAEEHLAAPGQGQSQET